MLDIKQIAGTKTGAFIAEFDGNAGAIYQAGVFVKLNMRNAYINTDGWYDPGTCRYTPKAPGIYVVGAHLVMGSGASVNDGTISIIAINKNGVLYRYLYNNAIGAAGDFYQNGVTLISLNGATDYVEWYDYHSIAVTTSMYNSDIYNGIYAWRIGP